MEMRNRFRFLLLLLVCIAACDNIDPSLPQYSNIGKCYINGDQFKPENLKQRSNLNPEEFVLGTITSIEKHPLTQKKVYVVQDSTGRTFYVSVFGAVIVNCDKAIATAKTLLRESLAAVEHDRQQASDSNSLIGKSAYNPSDMRYIGKVVSVNTKGATRRELTVRTTDGSIITVTYPKYVVLK